MTITVRESSQRRPSAGASGPVRRAFGPELITRMDALCVRGCAEGPLDLARDYLAATFAAAVGIIVGHPIMTVACVIYIGIRQRQLSNLTHEAIHTKLTRSRRANTIIGHLNCVALGEPFTPYRRSHRIHHAKLGSPDDPMLRSYISRRAHSAWPDKKAFVFHVIIGNALWQLPKSGLVTLVGKSGDESWKAGGARWAVWAAAMASATALGHGGDFALYWALPLIVVRPIVTWLTDLGNHAGLIHNSDVISQTRGWTSHVLTRHLLGGHNDDMYHPIHHWFPNIGWRRLPDAAAVLRENYPRWDEVPWCSGYFFRRRATPDIPCVLDDIVGALHLQLAERRPNT
ncbi:fatty acid desaturase [Nocardia sp. BMG111209]|uniref:fatty acid desaturase family protein n=1 Tax=Nocardia sp. BMG111209 TaxID=1160137 RepID=UPI0003A0BAD0|nr:fatty acid desaturase [Nocardia sp. BMG111209]